MAHQVTTREIRELCIVHVEPGEPVSTDDSPPADFNRQYASLLRKAARAVQSCPFRVTKGRVWYDNEGAWHFSAEVFDPGE
jgi:hypothetical protein